MTTPTDYRAALADIADLLDQATDPDDLGIRAEQAIARARALLAAPEAVGVADENFDDLFFAHCYSDDFGNELMEVEQFRKGARAVLSRYAHPAPVPVGDVRYEFSVFDDEDEEQAGGSMRTLQDATREGQRHLGFYGCGHRLELREVRTLPLPGDQP